MSDTFILIPSRIGSTRLKNKPLLDLNGETVIQRVFKIALDICSNSFVATDSELIVENIRSISSNIVMTSLDHISGTDRIFEAAEKLNIKDSSLIINLQGDEPFIPKELINNVINDFYENNCDVITASNEIKFIDELHNPNCVLVETDNSNFATKFVRTGRINNPKRHIGIYGYRFSTLEKLVKLEPTPNEIEFKLEQLRFLENDFSIYVTNFNGYIHHGIDTIEDVQRANNYLLNQ